MLLVLDFLKVGMRDLSLPWVGLGAGVLEY